MYFASRALTAITLSMALLGPPAAGSALAAKGDCAQPATDGTRPTTNDVLYILRAAVGQEACDLCVCDVDGNDRRTTDDALLTLRIAIGLGGQLQCRPCDTD